MNRFHNKYHRHNHHTLPTIGEADSSHDPIASPGDPFKGDFHILGQLSATSSVVSSLSVHGDAYFYGTVNTFNPISYSFDHVSITPSLTTTGYYFKIDTNFNNYPFMDIKYNGDSVFYIDVNKNVGIGTDTPTVKLDVNGNIKSINISATDIYSNSCNTNTISAANKAIFGYAEFNYVENLETTIKSISGNKNIYFYCGDNLNLALLNNRTNILYTKLGINIAPTEHLTVNGQQSFKQDGYILLDNSYNNTLRIINNRDKIDDQQNIFTFTSDGRYVIGNIDFDAYYKPSLIGSSNWNKINSHKISIFSKNNKDLLSLSQITTSPGPTSGPSMRFFKLNGELTNILPVAEKDNIGSIRAYGYNPDSVFNVNGNAGINFYAENAYFSQQSQGGCVSIFTVDKNDTTATSNDRVIVSSSGNVGIYNYTQLNALPTSKLTVINSENTASTPTITFNSGTNCLTSVYIEGGLNILNLTNLQLKHNSLTLDSSQYIDFNHTNNNILCGRIASTYKPSINGSANDGSSLTFYTTNNCDSQAAFPRITINPKGHLGVGISSPVARLHVLNDDGTINKNTTNDNTAVFASNGSTASISLSSSVGETKLFQANDIAGAAVVSTGNHIYLGVKTSTIDNTKSHIFITEGDISYRVSSRSGSLIASPSDINLKHNVALIQNSLEKIQNISGVTFNWDEQKQSIYKGKDIGVIAQEIEKIIPEAVFTGENQYKRVEYYKIIPLLIECIKELQVEINLLKNK